MALRLSTALRNKLLGTVSSIQGTTITLVNTGEGVTESGNTLLNLFRPGDIMTISGSVPALWWLVLRGWTWMISSK